MTQTKAWRKTLQTVFTAMAAIAAGPALTQTTVKELPSPVEVKEMTLSNGMTVWLNEDHSQPKVFGAVVVKAGANDCPNTGIAHYFEHILFKGTDRIGTTDYRAEKPWLDSISARYDRLSQTTDAAERARIQKDINRLSAEAAVYAIPNDFNHLISKYGGTGLNAGTSYDYTYYYNTFVPQFITQWCMLNSERLIAPVFRLFQGELETVYEEKNMYSDNMIMPAMERFMAAAYAGTPYEHPIIGSTESLKNPRLSDMQAFYDKYYVAGNMGLILCGDICRDSIMPLLESTFGRIRPGTAPARTPGRQTGYDGKTTVGLKVPLPIIKATGLCFRGPKEADKDAIVLEAALNLLSNTQETGLLDSLTNAGKWLMGIAAPIPQRDAGAIIVAAAPNIPFGSKKKAEDMMLRQIDRLKRGDFSDGILEDVKTEMARERTTALEKISDRATLMVSALAGHGSWSDYTALDSRIRAITKEDIIRVATKYLDGNFIRMVKKFGTYPKDRITQPGYKPVVPKNNEAESEYARMLDSIPVKPVEIKTVDFAADVTVTKLGPKATLYTAANPMNDVFTMDIIYRRGSLSDKMASLVAGLADSFGTDSLTKTEYGRAMQRLGTTVTHTATNDATTISLCGFDRNLGPSLKLLAHFMQHIKADSKKLADEKKGHAIMIKSFDKSYDAVFDAMMEKVMYGDESEYIGHAMTRAEMKAVTEKDVLGAYAALRRCEQDITYTGTADAATVAALVHEYLRPDSAATGHEDTFRRLLPVDRPVVYIYHAPKARQNIIGTYTMLPKAPTWGERATAETWAGYFGGGMSSLMFQEIREFRSYAYYSGGRLVLPPMSSHADAPAAFITQTGTQADKTLGALAVLDSLMNGMPMKEKNFAATRQTIQNGINNSYPSFRGKAGYVAECMFKGYGHDPARERAGSCAAVTADDVKKYYESCVRGANRAIIIVGRIGKDDIEKLKRYGEVRIMTKEDILKM